MTTNYSALIRGWDSFTSREKFRALYEYRQVHPYKPSKSTYARKSVRKSRARSPAFILPDGYYRKKDLVNRLGRDISTIKRYVAEHNIRKYRVGRFVAYCEEDLILVRDQAEINSRMGCKLTGVKNGRIVK